MAALLAGQGVSAVAREYAIPESTVSRWRANARRDAGLSDNIGELLLGYVRENLTTLQVQAVPSLPTYVRHGARKELE